MNRLAAFASAAVVRLRRTALVLGLAVVVVGCSGDDITNPNLFSDQDDVALGKQVDQEIRSNPQEFPILKNRPDVKQYVEAIGNAILASPHITKRDVYPYQYEIIHDDNTVNAFCTPGGYIYVYTGLLKFVDNKATLAGVLAHEIAHAEQRHATERLTKSYGLQFLIGLLLGEDPSFIEEMAVNIGAGLGMLANSRSDETEADEYSFKYLQSTPYYPGAIRYFFEKIVEQQGTSGSDLTELLSTHPEPDTRIDDIEKMLQENNTPPPTEATLFTQDYQQFKATLP